MRRLFLISFITGLKRIKEKIKIITMVNIGYTTHMSNGDQTTLNGGQ
nr:MAG TPA: hypothetical protein [Bacteriophage sp.]